MSIELAPTEPTASPASASTTSAETRASVIENMHPRLATADPLCGEELERHVIAMRNARLQGLAQRVAAARSRLLDLTAAAESLSMAVDAAHYTGCDPEHWLQNDLAEVLAQIELAEAGRKRTESRLRSRSARVTPLRVAVSERHTSLVRERDVLRERVHLLRKGSGMDTAPTQFLRQAGLTSEQIASLGPVNPGEKELAAYIVRLAEIEPVVAAIERWFGSGYLAHEHLDGLGFDHLTEAAMPVDEVAAP